MRAVAVALALAIALVTLGLLVLGSLPEPAGDLAPGERPPTSGSSDSSSTAGDQEPDRSEPPPGPTVKPPLIRADRPREAGPSIETRFDEVDAALGELVRGHLAFNTPERMQLAESRTIALIASPEMEPPRLSQELRHRIGGDDPVAVAAVQIAPVMEAQLAGAPAFDVAALTPLRQPVSRAEPTEWRWRVTARDTGTQTLHLTMNAVITVGDERFPRVIDVFDRDIQVEVSAAQRARMFVGANWQWLTGTIVIPVGAWLWTRRRARRGGRRRR